MGFVDEKSKYYETSDDVNELFTEVLKSISLPFDIKWKTIGNSKQKKFLQISKLSDVNAFLLEADVLVSFNEDFMYKLDDEARQILIEEELDKVYVNADNGKVKMLRPDCVTFTGLIEKFTYPKVQRAKKLQIEILESKEQTDRELEAI